MARRTTTSTLKRVRRVLLFGLLLFVATLISLYLFGRRPAGGPAPIGGEQTPEGPEVTIIGREFRYEVSEDGEKLFDIEADRLLSDESDLYILEGVKIAMQREDGREYTISAERGTYRLERNEATLKGSVVLTGSSGLRLETGGLELTRRGKVVVSSAPVRLAMGDAYQGRANRLEVTFNNNRIMLAGEAELRTSAGSYPSASLQARRIVFFRDTHSFLAEGDVVLRRESDTLRARRLSANFDDADRRILFALASWQVEASLRQVDSNGLPSVATAAGDQLSVVFDEVTGDPTRMELDAPQGGLAQLQITDASGLRRRMLADYLWAEFSAGRLQRAQGLGGVTLDEGLEFAPSLMIRQICSDSVEASFDATGSLTALSLDGAVNYEQPDLRAGGDQLTAGGPTMAIDLVGDKAWIESAEGRLEAPQIHYESEEGRAQAVGGVRAEIGSTSGPVLATGEDADLPVRIEAAEAEWLREPQEFRFRDNVRAWQGESFLVSQTLGLEDGELIADGGVRTVWHERTAVTDSGGEEPEDPEDAPISISSSKLRYVEGENRIVFQGAAQIVQGGRSMGCSLLQLQLDDDDDFERMYCEGGTQILDEDGGSQIQGDAAIYNTEAAKVKIVGDPVRLTQATGGTISAKLMVYDFDTAIAEVNSVSAEDAPLFMTLAEYLLQFPPASAPIVAPTPVPGEPLAEPADGAPPPATGDTGALGETVGNEPVVTTEGAVGPVIDPEAEPAAEDPPAQESAAEEADDGDGSREEGLRK